MHDLTHIPHHLFGRLVGPGYAHWRPGDPRPDRHPFRAESPVLLPGDKVRDKRDGTRYRVVARIAYLDDEVMRLRRDDGTEIEGKASELVPHLEIVAMSA